MSTDTYLTLYAAFGALFLCGSIGYWVVSRVFRDLDRAYERP